MIAKKNKRITITLPKELDEFLDLTVAELNKKETTELWTKSKLIERTLLIHINLAEETANEKDAKA